METKINYNKKYLKYKLKYNKLKEGGSNRISDTPIYCHYVGDEAVFFNESHPYKFPGYIDPTYSEYIKPEDTEVNTPSYKDQYGYEHNDKLVYHQIFALILENCYQKYLEKRVNDTCRDTVIFKKPLNYNTYNAVAVQCDYTIYGYSGIMGVYFIDYTKLYFLAFILL
jgi:hypothetical protein